MKTLYAAVVIPSAGRAVAADMPSKSMEAADALENHRYIVERIFPPNAIASLDAAAKARINKINAMFGVKWEM